MALFYDPASAAEQQKVEAILRKGGIQYVLRSEPSPGIGPMQIHVAEEDLPEAERLLEKGLKN